MFTHGTCFKFYTALASKQGGRCGNWLAFLNASAKCTRPNCVSPPLKIFQLPEQTFYESSVHLIGAYPPAVFQNGILRVFPSCVSKRMPAGVQWTFRKCGFWFCAEFKIFDLHVLFNSYCKLTATALTISMRILSRAGFLYTTPFLYWVWRIRWCSFVTEETVGFLKSK